MNRRLVLAVVLVLVSAIVLCPHKPSRRQVNPDQLLKTVLDRYQPGLAMPGEPRFEGIFWISRGNHNRLVLRNYTPLVEGRERIAGRDCWLVRLKPNAKRRPWRQVWIDRKSTDILALRDWDHNDRVRRSARGAVEAARTGDDVVELKCHQTLATALGDLHIPGYIPSGFEIANVGVWSDSSPGDKCVIYSDGLFNISLFYRFSVARAREQHKRLDARDCGHALAVSVPLPDGVVVVVADLPEQELLRIARSIH